MPASAIPGVLVRLLELALTLQTDTLQVIDGPPTLIPPGVTEALVIGADWDPNEAIVATSTLEPYSDYAQLEVVTVPGAVMVKIGEPTTAAPTARAYAILAAFKGLLTADPTLAGAVGYADDAGGGGKAEASSLARLTSTSLRRSVSGGTRCVVSFTVGAQALIPD